MLTKTLWNVAKSEFKDLKLEKETMLKVFRIQKWKKKKRKKPNLYIWFSLCSQKYKRIIKLLYFIYSL
jgi:hypothetical protein